MSIITGTIIELAAKSTAALTEGAIIDSIAKDLEKIVGQAIGQMVCVKDVRKHAVNERAVIGDIHADRNVVIPFDLTLDPEKVVLTMHYPWDIKSGKGFTYFDLEARGVEQRIATFYHKVIDAKDSKKSQWYKKVTENAVAEVEEAARNLSKVLKKHKLELAVFNDCELFTIVPKGVTVDYDVDDELVLDIDRFPEITLPVAGYFDTEDHVLVMPEE